MADVLVVGDRIFPGLGGEDANCALALAKALSDAKHRVSILTLLPESQAAEQPGLAKRLRTVQAHMADGDRVCSLFEGASPLGHCTMYVLGVDSIDRGHAAAFLASAAKSLEVAGLFNAQAVIGWGEMAAPTFSTVQATTRFFVLPGGLWSQPLSEHERAALDPNAADLALARNSLAGLGAIDADTVIFPSPSSAQAFTHSAEFSYRASDQQVFSIQFGSDDPPFNPLADTTLVRTYGPGSMGGKLACRKYLAKQAGLSLGPRTLLMGTSPLLQAAAGKTFLQALPTLLRADMAFALPDDGDPAMLHHVQRLSLDCPGKIAVVPRTSLGQSRELLAGVDAILLLDDHNRTARNAGIAMRYGTLPMAPQEAAYQDYFVDFDPRSKTGNGILFAKDSVQDLLSSVDRVRSLRFDSGTWADLQELLLKTAPRWERAAETITQLMDKPGATA